MADPDDYCGGPDTRDPDGDWTNRLRKAVVSSVCIAVICLTAAWLLGLAWNWD